MPVAGRKPKPQGQSRTRHKPTHEWIEVPNVPFPGRDLPECRPDGRPWPEWTLRWWGVVSTMPHCVLWTESDWQFAADTALVAAEVHEGNSRLSTELRNREKVLGTTVDFRRDLRIRYVDPPEDDEGAEAQVTRLDDYRELYGG